MKGSFRKPAYSRNPEIPDSLPASTDVDARFEAWKRRVRVDFAAFRAYAKAAYEATDEYREGLYLYLLFYGWLSNNIT